MSKPTISKLKKKLMELSKDKVRERDGNECQWCGRWCEGSNRHVSHVIAVSHGNALSFDLLNMKVLCYHCHRNKWHLDHIASGAMEWFKGKFPDRYEYLMKHKEDEVHWKLADYQKMIDDLS